MIKEEQNIKRLFDLAKSEPVGFSFDAASNEFKQTLNSTSYASKIMRMSSAKFKFLKIIIMSTLSIFIITILSIIFFNSNSKVDQSKKNISQQEFITSKNDSLLNEIKETTKKATTEQITKENIWIQDLPIKKVSILTEKHVLSEEPVRQEVVRTTEVKDDYEYFPKLTPEEIEQNDKRIKEMVKDFVKKKKGWSFYPSGAFIPDSSTVSVQSFFVKSTEVTNLEYKTFLFDLLKEGKKEAFNKAKPNQKAWSEIFGDVADPMKNHYFSHDAYSFYPVCNVSVEGAKMFCEWLTNKVKLSSKEPIQNFRLPMDLEWKYVASEMGRLKKYAWEGEFLRNYKGCYMVNFHAGTESDTIKNEYSADGGFFAVKVDSYSCNAFGVYSISGNVAEMVVVNEKNEVGVLGGGFLSTSEELLVNSKPKSILHPLGSPDIGFRPVITLKID